MLCLSGFELYPRWVPLNNEKKSGNSKNCYSLVKNTINGKFLPCIETSIIDPRSIKINMAVR